jgi:hypothetical protein
MIDRPYNDSVPTACVFIEIFSIFPPIPKTNKQQINSAFVWTKPRIGRVQAYNSAEKITTRLLLNFDTSHPATGSEIKRPVGKPRRTVPKAALFKCNFNCMSGIRDPQLEKHKPARKKKQLMAIRCTFLLVAGMAKSCSNLKQ